MKVLSSLLFLVLINSTASFAGENSKIGRGTQGLTVIPITLANSGNSALTCSASTAHWYSVALGDIKQGATLQFTLWKNVSSGEVFVLNAQQDHMPVQSLWCGESSNAYNSRQQLMLPDRQGINPEPITLRCAAVAGRVHCQPATLLAG